MTYTLEIKRSETWEVLQRGYCSHKSVLVAYDMYRREIKAFQPTWHLRATDPDNKVIVEM